MMYLLARQSSRAILLHPDTLPRADRVKSHHGVRFTEVYETGKAVSITTSGTARKQARSCALRPSSTSRGRKHNVQSGFCHQRFPIWAGINRAIDRAVRVLGADDQRERDEIISASD